MNNELDTLSQDWSLIDGQGLVRVVPVESFSAATQFIVQLAAIAETLHHDPQVDLTGRKVTITLISHDTNEVTERDYEYAKAIDELVTLN